MSLACSFPKEMSMLLIWEWANSEPTNQPTIELQVDGFVCEWDIVSVEYIREQPTSGDE